MNEGTKVLLGAVFGMNLGVALAKFPERPLWAAYGLLFASLLYLLVSSIPDKDRFFDGK